MSDKKHFLIRSISFSIDVLLERNKQAAPASLKSPAGLFVTWGLYIFGQPL
jgi:hypothetical protein